MAEENIERAHDTKISEQAAAPWQQVQDALKSVGDRLVATREEVGVCALRQAEENSAAVFEALKAMASTRSPADIYLIYSRFLNDAAQRNGAQLREMSQALTRAGQEAWKPVTDALKGHAPTGTNA